MEQPRPADGLSCGHTLVMGFNPHRRQRSSAWDIAFVAAALAASAALLLWALLG